MDRSVALQRLIDENDICDVTARFADAATRCHIAAFRDTRTEQGTWVIGSPARVRAEGIEQIADTLAKLRAGKDFPVQFANCGPVNVDGAEASVRTYCQEAARGPGETYYRKQCVAFDRLRRVGPGWRYVSRAFHSLWLDTSPYSGQSVPLFDAHGAILANDFG